MSNIEYAQFIVVDPDGRQKHYFQGPTDEKRQDYGGTDPKTVPAALTRLSSEGWEVVGPPTQKLRTAVGGSQRTLNTVAVVEETYLLQRFTAK